jgi:hypothetical protein
MSLGTLDAKRSADNSTLTYDEAVHRARALAPFLRERAAQTEADRRRNLDAIRNGAPTERALRTRSTASWGYATRLLCKPWMR